MRLGWGGVDPPETLDRPWSGILRRIQTRTRRTESPDEEARPSRTDSTSARPETECGDPVSVEQTPDHVVSRVAPLTSTSSPASRVGSFVAGDGAGSAPPSKRSPSRK
jgi:hypothetical protein